jgi:hypothetical protein
VAVFVPPLNAKAAEQYKSVASTKAALYFFATFGLRSTDCYLAKMKL